MKLPKIKIQKSDIVWIILLLVVVGIVSIPNWLPKDGCEVARPGYKCESFENVMIENCVYWGTYDCDTSADVSLTQVEWYLDNLCDLQNKYHNTGLECSNLRKACNTIVGNQICKFGV